MSERALSMTVKVDADELAALEKRATEGGWLSGSLPAVADYVRLMALTVIPERLALSAEKLRLWHVVFPVNETEKATLEDLAQKAGFVHAADYVREVALTTPMPDGLKMPMASS